MNERVLRLIAEALDRPADPATATVTVTATAWTPERFWACAAPVRLSAPDLAKALGVSVRSIYRSVGKGMPCRKRDGVMVFVAGDVREWMERREVVVNARPAPIAFGRRRA